MNLDDAWHAIDEQRLTVAALLGDLNDQEWTQPSLCEGWTVRDVAAHLTLQQNGPGQALAQIVRHPGGMNRMIHNAACRRAAAPTDELIAAIRGMVGSRKRNVGVSRLETLTDILVHGQDIAIPLGRHLPTRTDAAAAAASRMWSRGWAVLAAEAACRLPARRHRYAVGGRRRSRRRRSDRSRPAAADRAAGCAAAALR